MSAIERLVHLKIKLQSMGAEARFIRRQELKAKRQARYLSGRMSYKHGKGSPRPEVSKRQLEISARPESAAEASDAYLRYWNLHQHRAVLLRKHARAASIAYGFLKGKFAFEQIERGAKSRPNFAEIWDSVKRFSGLDRRNDPDLLLLKDEFCAWIGLSVQELDEKIKVWK